MSRRSGWRMASYWPDFPSFKAKIEVGGVGSLKQRRNRVQIPFKLKRSSLAEQHTDADPRQHKAPSGCAAGSRSVCNWFDPSRFNHFDSVALAVEQATVNRQVGGSNPSRIARVIMGWLQACQKAIPPRLLLRSPGHLPRIKGSPLLLRR